MMVPNPWSRLLPFLIVKAIASTGQNLTCNIDTAGDQSGYCQCDIFGLSSSAAFDLRPLFAGGPLETESVEYRFTLNGCSSTECPNHDDDVAVCQRKVAVPNSIFSLGSIQSVAYDISGSIPSANQWLIVATYSMGDATATLNRTAQVRYIFNESVSTPLFTFVVEDPTQLNYFFTVESNLISPQFPTSQAPRISTVGWVFIGLGIIVVVGIVSVTSIVCIIVQVRRHGYERIEDGNNDPMDNRGNVSRSEPGGPLKWTLLTNKDSDVTDRED